MSIIEKLHCDYCQRDENMALNHVWTVLRGPTRLEILRGLENRAGAAEHIHLCSADCLGKAVARWAAGISLASYSSSVAGRKVP